MDGGGGWKKKKNQHTSCPWVVLLKNVRMVTFMYMLPQLKTMIQSRLQCLCQVSFRGSGWAPGSSPLTFWNDVSRLEDNVATGYLTLSSLALILFVNCITQGLRAAFPLQPWFGPGLFHSAALGSRAGGSFKVIESVFLCRWIVLNVFGLAGLH